MGISLFFIWTNFYCNFGTNGQSIIKNYLPKGGIVSLYGEWIGKGVVEGYDEDGNYYELEVD